ncbi:MAG: DinB family protein [Actinobacteria bacterium]|nr:DinB family protein [Actinomycetota bacterium]
MTERAMPAGLNDERSLLNGWLDYYRATLLAKCDGLSGAQLITRSCEPSPMSLIGLVRHMTEMERAYGHRIADWSITFLYCSDDDEDADFQPVTAANAAADLETFREHCARTRQIMASYQLDDTFGTANLYTLRWFYLYLIKEYARHLGHADLLRERIDGAVGE